MHRAGTKNPATGRSEGGKWFVPPDELAVLIQGRLPAYISWEQYLANQKRLKQNRSLHETPGVAKRGAALLSGLTVCSKCGYHLTTHYSADKRPSYTCNEFWRDEALHEPCGRIAAGPVDNLVANEVLRALEPAALELSLRTIENVEQERQRLHDQWSQKLERARHEVARAERQYHAVEPENRLVARTLEARWEDALKQQRQVEEDYHRFLAKLPATLAAADRERIRALSQNVSRLWQAEGTTAQDRKQIIRCLVDQVTITIDRATEENEVTIAWKGGMSTVHQAARAVGTFEQLKDYRRLTERIRELHGEGLHLFQIAAKLNEEGFVPPRRRGKFTESGIGDLVRKLGLVGELFRDNLLRQDEWWISDLASRVGVGAQKIHYWVQQGWINYRRTPSGKHFIVWADAEDLRRLKKIATKTNSWTAARHPDLVIPKKRSVR